jgi:hypothetical protein
MKRLPRDLLGLAAEYLVASELCRRGLYAQLTLGHHKRADLLVESASGIARIQVKAKQGREWPAVKGISQERDFLVLADFQSKELSETPDIYVLSADDWRQIIEQVRQRHPQAKIGSDLVRVEFPDGWTGVNLKVRDVERWKSAWEKVIVALSPSEDSG